MSERSVACFTAVIAKPGHCAGLLIQWVLPSGVRISLTAPLSQPNGPSIPSQFGGMNEMITSEKNMYPK